MTLALGLLAAAGHAANLAPNPGAELAEGKLPGFALYTGAGKATVSPSTTEKHSGESSACLEATGWWRAKDAADTPENRTVNMALVLAENDGFTGKGALPGKAGTLYGLSFWYKGDLSSATVRATAWPSQQSGQTERVSVAELSGTIMPGAEWKCFGATFRLPAKTTCFAVQVGAIGRDKDGYRLGRVFVDDVRIVEKEWPEGEMRAMWWGGPKERGDKGKSLAEAGAMFDRMRGAGFNTLFLYANSLEFVAVERPELRKSVSGSDWDYYGGVVNLATAKGLQVHAWYAPWTYKNASRSSEAKDHPDWRTVSADGRPSEDSICFIRPESRQYQLDLLRRMLERYPDLAGLHIEEPGHPTCHCTYCARLAKEWLGLDIAGDPTGSEPSLRRLAAYLNGEFFLRLRQMASQVRPEAWLSANGSAGANPDWGIARDWPTWSRKGYIDFYVPQIYTEDPGQFASLAQVTQETLGSGAMVAGLAVTWTGIYPRKQDPEKVAAEIAAARRLGAKGFCVFEARHLDDPHWEGITRAIRE